MGKRVFFSVVIVALIVMALPIGVSAQDGEGPAQVGLRPDAPQYALHGPYWVGTQDFAIDAESPLEITVWYPALNPDGTEGTTTYEYNIKFDVPEGIVGEVFGHAIRDGVPDMSSSPYPLIVLSHGFCMGRTAYVYMAEHLASYGFVVIAPDHHEYFDEAWSDLWKSTIARPQDVTQVIDYAEVLGAAEGDLAGLIDTDRVAVTGHSYGGYTALAAAGGQFDFAGFNARCQSAREAGDPNVWLCDLIEPHEMEMAQLAGFETPPEGLWPSLADPRVDVIIPMAGDSYLFDQAGLAAITMPVMSIGGTRDSSTPYEWGAHPTFEYVSSESNTLVTFEEAEHMIFGSDCTASPWYLELGAFPACSDAVWDIDRVHDLINHFMTAFLLAELNGDADAAAALAPDAVQFPGVQYETIGF